MGDGSGQGDAAAPGVKPGAVTALLRALVATTATGEGSPVPLFPGTVVGRFEILRELGSGAFGVVYEARDRELGRSVALKVVQPVRTGGESVQAREAEAAARLSHPNLVTLHDVGQSEHGPYLVFELLRGRTLERRLHDGPLTPLEAVHVAVEVARGLAHAHAEGVVHRDLKPSNVFLTERGAVKILDFGMAHAFGRKRPSGGTPAYMAPEQWSEGPEDERTDVFALGVILHRMVSGRLPYPEDGGRWASGAAEPAGLEVAGAPSLGALVARLLARAAAGRPRDGAEALAALEPIEAGLRGGPAAAWRGRLARRGGLAALLVGGGLAALSGLGRHAWRAGRAPTAAGPGPGVAASIAVLPFADLSPDHDQGYYADGISEEILDALSRVEGLKVPGRASSFWFKGKEARLRDIAGELEVAHVLEGSVRRAGNRLRIFAEVVRAADGERLWSQSFDREATDVFAVQDEVARAVVGALRVKLLPGGHQPTSGARTDSLAAYEQYLLGRQLLGDGSPASIPAARDAFQRAVALDPGYAAAQAGLSQAWSDMAGYLAETPDEVTRYARLQLASAERAIELLPQLPDGYIARADYRIAFAWDWQGALADVEQAATLGRSSWQLHANRSRALGMLGRLPEAVAAARQATEVDPLARGAWSNLANLLTAAGDYAGGEQAARRGLVVAPGNATSGHYLGVALLEQGRHEEALAEFARNPYAWWRLQGLAIAHHRLGHERASRAALEALEGRYATMSAYQIAEAHASRGERAAAFDWLERARRQRDGGLETLRMDGLFRGLHGDPRWASFLREMNLPVE